MMERDNGGIFRRITRRKQCDNFRRLLHNSIRLVQTSLIGADIATSGALKHVLFSPRVYAFIFLNYHALELFIKIS